MPRRSWCHVIRAKLKQDHLFNSGAIIADDYGLQPTVGQLNAHGGCAAIERVLQELLDGCID